MHKKHKKRERIYLIYYFLFSLPLFSFALKNRRFQKRTDFKIIEDNTDLILVPLPLKKKLGLKRCYKSKLNILSASKFSCDHLVFGYIINGANIHAFVYLYVFNTLIFVSKYACSMQCSMHGNCVIRRDFIIEKQLSR